MVDTEQVKIPKGYKQTEVGVIPEDWEEVKVQDVCGFIVPGRNKPLRFDGDIPWITTPDLTDGRVVYQSGHELKISKEEAKSVGSKIVPPGAVIMSCVGELGLVAIAGCSMVLNQQLHAFLPTSKISNFYLAYALKTQENYFYSAATKTALPYLNKDNCNATPIALPPLKEQTAIANALFDVDNLIASLETLIAKKSAIKTAAMQQLLTGKKRLPAFVKASEKQGAKQSSELDNTSETAQAVQTKQTSTLNSDLYKESGEGLDAKPNQHSEVSNANNKQTTPRPGYKLTELGEIPEDWDLEELGSVTKYIGSGKTNTKGSGEYPLYGSTGKIGTCKEAEYEGASILVARVGANAGSLNYVSGRYGVSDNTIMIKLGSESDIHFYKYQLIKYNLNSLVFGSGQPLITGSQLKAISLPTPSFKEQAAIANVLSDMDTELGALQQRLSKTQKIKQGMMQELLTGKTRLI